MSCRIASGLLGLLLAGCASAPQGEQAEKPYAYPDKRTYADFTKNIPAKDGLRNEIVTLKNANGAVKVSLVGANVFSYVPAGGEEVLFASKNVDFLADEFQHVGIPVVWPWFGMLGDVGSCFHGLTRHLRWTVVEKAEGPAVSRLVLELNSSAETRRLWPYDFRLHYTVTLGERLTISLVTVNTDHVPFSITQGFHAYFRVSDVDTVVLRGLDGCRNDSLWCSKPDPVFLGDLQFHAGEGRVFTPGRGEYVLFDEGLNRALAIAARGNSKTILWSLDPAESRGKWFGPDDWKHFACVEPSTLCRESAITVAPGKEYELRMSVKAVPL